MPLNLEQIQIVHKHIRLNVRSWPRRLGWTFDTINLENECVWNESAVWRALDKAFGLALGDDIRHQYMFTPEGICWYVGVLLDHPVVSGERRPSSPDWFESALSERKTSSRRTFL